MSVRRSFRVTKRSGEFVGDLVVEEIRERLREMHAQRFGFTTEEASFHEGRIAEAESILDLIQKRDAEQGYLLKEVTDKLRYITIRLESLASEKEQEG